MESRTSHQARGRIIWEEKKKRQEIIEEFFRAYETARRANRAFFDTYVYGPSPSQPSRQTPSCLAVLGLSWPCTVADVKQAFRAQVKRVHPDAGGNSDAFQALHGAYQQALSLVS